jgi:ketosteroid isomerase-like protein
VSPKNIAAVRAVYKEWGKGNFRAGVDLLDPHVLFILRPEFIDAGTFFGVEGVGDYMRGFLAAWTNLTIAAGEFIEAGDTVVVAVHQRGVGLESDIRVEMQYFQVWTFRGRTVVRLENIWDRAQALEAVGLPE